MRDPLGRVGQRCLACTSPFRDAIAARFSAGTMSGNAIADEFGLSRDSVKRHRRNCLPKLAAAVAKASTGKVVSAQLADVSDTLVLSASNLSAMIDEIVVASRAALAKFKDSGDPKDVKMVLDAAIAAARLWGDKISAFPRAPTHVTDSRTLVLNGIDPAILRRIAQLSPTDV